MSKKHKGPKFDVAAHVAQADAALNGTEQVVEEGNLDAPPEGEVPASQPEPQPAQVLKVKAGIKSRGIRQAWYELALKYDGKPVAEFLAEGKAKPPTNYTARSKFVGQPHDAQRRLRRMVWLGWVTLS